MSFRKHNFPYQVHFSNPISSFLPLPIPTTFSPSSYSPSIPSPPSPPLSFQNNTCVVSPSPISSPNSSSPTLSPSLPSPVAPSVPLCRSSRSHHTPFWMQDFVPTLSTTTSPHFDFLLPSLYYTSFLTQLLSLREPASYAEASLSPG